MHKVSQLSLRLSVVILYCANMAKRIVEVSLAPDIFLRTSCNETPTESGGVVEEALLAYRSFSM